MYIIVFIIIFASGGISIQDLPETAGFQLRDGTVYVQELSDLFYDDDDLINGLAAGRLAKDHDRLTPSAFGILV